eukprot:gene2018-3917_t
MKKSSKGIFHTGTTKIIYVGLAIFIITVAALAILSQRESSTVWRDNIRYSSLKRNKQTRVQSKSAIKFPPDTTDDKTYRKKRIYTHSHNHLSNSTILETLNTNTLWSVISEVGVTVRQDWDIHSTIIRILPKGTILIEKDIKCNIKNFMKNKDFTGGDILPYPLASVTPYDCCLQCLHNIDCHSWTFIKGNRACWLKGPLAKPVTGSKELISGHIASRTISVTQHNHNIQGQKDPIHNNNPNNNNNNLKPCCKNSFLSNNSKIFSISLPSLQYNTYTSNNNNNNNNNNNIKEKEVSLNSNSNSMLLRTSRTTLDWTQQWPIGTGNFGALIGGTFDEEVIPLTIADLYITNNNNNNNNNNNIKNKKEYKEIFKKARKDLINKNFESAERTIDLLKMNNELGMFQYAADLLLFFSMKNIYTKEDESITKLKNNHNNHNHNKNSNSKESLRYKNQPKNRPNNINNNNNINHNNDNNNNNNNMPPVRTHREALSRMFSEQFHSQSRSSSSSSASSSDMGSVHFNQGMLDMETGTAISEFIFENNNGFENMNDESESETSSSSSSSKLSMNNNDVDSNDVDDSSVYSVHRREWFASSADNVMVGSFSCKHMNKNNNNNNNKDNNDDNDNCLNFAFQLSRTMNQEFGNGIEIKQRITKGYPYKHNNEYIPNYESLYRFEFTLSQNSLQPAAKNKKKDSVKNDLEVNICGVIVCTNGENVILIQGTSQDFLICNDEYSAYIILSMDLDTNENTSERFHMYDTNTDTDTDIKSEQDNYNKNKYKGSASTTTSKMSSKDRCWSTVSAALYQGIDTVRQRHLDDMRDKMNRIGLSIHPSVTKRNMNTTMTMTMNNADESYLVCPNEILATRLQAFAFHYGRYLLFSSGSKSVANLQGLWADGPTSAWNGDYHLNINLQMIYWASDVTAMRETIPPLVKWIHHMMRGGERTAKEVYGCNGWVGHAYTDNKFNMGVLGDLQWSLCVSCGAWMALHLWEHLSFHYSHEFLINSVLEVFRGIAQFFLEYMWEDAEGRKHTGPTTSAENSYLVVKAASASVLASNKVKMKTKSTPILNKRQQQQQQKQQQQQLSEQNRQELLQRRIAEFNAKGEPLPRELLELLAAGDAQGQGQRQGMDPQMMLMMQQQQQQQEQLLLQRSQGEVRVLTFSPALDISVLRHVANAFVIAVQWAESALQSGDIKESDGAYTRSQNNADKILADRFVSTVRRMPGSAVPVIDSSNGLIREYPTPSDNSTSETHDMGHRHFSSMHCELAAASVRTMRAKSQDGGGHTSWSAAWESCLWSRLGRPEEAWLSLSRILRKYSAANLLSLHPQLEKVGMEGCSTCFRDPSSGSEEASGAKMNCDMSRGMQTTDSWKFQLDGNMGIVAAVSEMLVQSHTPEVLLLLPALPRALADSGTVRGLHIRGGGRVSVSWEEGSVTAAIVSYATTTTTISMTTSTPMTAHPWLYGFEERPSGFFRSKLNTSSSSSSHSSIPKDTIIEVNSPNKLSVIQSPLRSCTITAKPAHSSDNVEGRVHSRIRFIPGNCHIWLCRTGLSDDTCVRELDILGDLSANRFSSSIVGSE